MFTQEAIAGYIGTGIWTLINLAVIYWFLHHFLFKPFARVIEKRRQKIEGDLAEAEQKQKEATEQAAQTKKILEESTRQAADIVNQARQNALTQEAQILKEADVQAKSMIDRANEETRRMRSNMYVEMRKEIADLSVAIASKVIGSAMNQEEQRKRVENLLDKEIEAKQKEESGAVTNG